MKTTMDEDSMSPPPSYSTSILDQIDNRTRGNSRRKKHDKNNDMDLEHLLFAATNWKSAGSDPTIPIERIYASIKESPSIVSSLMPALCPDQLAILRRKGSGKVRIPEDATTKIQPLHYILRHRLAIMENSGWTEEEIKELCVKIVWLHPETLLLKKKGSMRNLRESRHSRDLDSNGVHIDTASIDIEGCSGKDDVISSSENEIDTKLGIKPFTPIEIPHVIDDGHVDRVIDNNLNNFLDLVADEVYLPPESEFEITKSIWDWLGFVYIDDEITEKDWSRENYDVRRSKLFMYGEPKSSVRYLDNEIYDVRSPYPIECMRPRTSVSLSADVLFLIQLLSELLVSEIPIGRNSGNEEILKVKAERENVRQTMTLLVQIIAEIPVRIFFLVVYTFFLLCQKLFFVGFHSNSSISLKVISKEYSITKTYKAYYSRDNDHTMDIDLHEKCPRSHGNSHRRFIVLSW